MMMTKRRLLCLFFVFFFIGCGDGVVTSNQIVDDEEDAGVREDVVETDVGTPTQPDSDAGIQQPDPPTEPDAQSPDAGIADVEQPDDPDGGPWQPDDAIDDTDATNPVDTPDAIDRDGDDEDIIEDDGAWFECPANGISNGWNEMTVDGRNRGFFADLPRDGKRPMGLLFSWHGFLERAILFRPSRAFDPNAVGDLPMAILTPEDTFLLPIPPNIGLGWDIRPNDSRDLRFFLAMIDCMDDQFPVMHEAIYSYGFSAGAVMTALIHSTYPNIVSAAYVDSGAWFNDPNQQGVVNPVIGTLLAFTWNWRWPALNAADGGTAVITNGGPRDQIIYNIFGMDFYIFNLQAASHAAEPFLRSNGRRVIDCAHNGGHIRHPDISPHQIQHFLAAHRTGTPHPNGLHGLPGSCRELFPF